MESGTQIDTRSGDIWQEDPRNPPRQKEPQMQDVASCWFSNELWRRRIVWLTWNLQVSQRQGPEEAPQGVLQGPGTVPVARVLNFRLALYFYFSFRSLQAERKEERVGKAWELSFFVGSFGVVLHFEPHLLVCHFYTPLLPVKNPTLAHGAKSCKWRSQKSGCRNGNVWKQKGRERQISSHCICLEFPRFWADFAHATPLPQAPRGGGTSGYIGSGRRA